MLYSFVISNKLRNLGYIWDERRRVQYRLTRDSPALLRDRISSKCYRGLRPFRSEKAYLQQKYNLLRAPRVAGGHYRNDKEKDAEKR